MALRAQEFSLREPSPTTSLIFSFGAAATPASRLWRRITPIGPGAATTRGSSRRRRTSRLALARLEPTKFGTSPWRAAVTQMRTESPAERPPVRGSWFDDQPRSAARLRGHVDDRSFQGLCLQPGYCDRLRHSYDARNLHLVRLAVRGRARQRARRSRRARREPRQTPLSSCHSPSRFTTQVDTPPR